ncbi:MAG: FkbM family methyltransferase [Elusimicrobia bacterium]|nr:FkbM family methyltransferase [Elusimicrobiota bacterium]
MNERIKTTVLDAGGRYGLHPSWKPFTGELEYYLFEPDPLESARLQKKYDRRSAEVKVIGQAVAEKDGKLTINFFKNRAMSSALVRNPVSSLFKGERLREVDIVESIETTAVSIDSFCGKNGLALDFLKLDTEGSEFQILQGAKKQLQDNILGVRCEVSFDHIFEGMPLFSTVHDFMLSQDFYLLNIDYEGRGDYQNDFVKTDGRYGILTASDAVWLKRTSSLFDRPSRFSGDVESRVMKYAAFCINNNAGDVAIDILLKARRDHGLSFDALQDSRLFKFLDLSIHKLFYGLKWQPGQSLRTHQEIFSSIFGKKMKEMNEFMQSEELNPD